MRAMFEYCYALEAVNVSNFNTENVTNMKDMFLKCYSLKEIDISDFSFKNYNDIESMFEQCSEELKMKIKKQKNLLK